MSDLAARNGGLVGLAALALILLSGLALRLDYAWDGRAPVYDAEAYARIAANLEAGEGFTAGPGATQPSSNYSPGLPLLVAGVYELRGGEDERPARIVLALIGSLAVLLTYLLGRRLGGPLAGMVGAAAVAGYPALLEYQGMLMGEPLATTLLAAALLTLLWAGDDGAPAWRQLPSGALLGALALTRPEYLGVALLLAIAVLGRRLAADWRRSLAQAGLLVLGLAVVVAPWTARNAFALDRFVPISTGGGQVLFAGSYLPSGGDPERVGREVLERHPGLTRQIAAQQGLDGSPVRADGASKGELTAAAVVRRVRLEQILAALAAQRYPGMETDRALARMGRERLGEEIGERPLEYVEFVAAKVWRVWGHGPREVMQRTGWELLHWALVALALAGAVTLAMRRSWDLVPIAIVLLAITAISAILVASPRRALVVLPATAALAGVAVTAGRDSLARRWNG